MQKNIKIYTLLILVLLLFLALSGIVPQPFGSILYLSGFALTIGIGLVYSSRDKTRREEESGQREPSDMLLSLNKSCALVAPLVFPVIALVFLTSFLTSLLLSALGVVPPESVEENILELILLHAVAPAILEEAAFRYLPMKLFMPYSKRATLIISSIYFAFFHMDFAKIPYALVAGVAFMLINLASGSVLPSVILHFLNNLVSIIWIFTGTDYVLPFILTLCALSLASLVIVLVLRKKYRKLFSGALGDKREGYFSYLILLIPIISIIESSVKLIWGR